MWGVAFLLVLALLAVAADRVLVGFGREVLYQYHRERGRERRVFATV